MFSEVLYDLAFRWKESRIWQKLWDSQLFAVNLADNTVLYCCVMGRAGQHRALAVYPGEEGLETYRLMSFVRSEDLDELEMKEIAMSQNCIMLSFVDKDELSPEEIEAVQAYCQDRGIRLRGKIAFPKFERFLPYHHPWEITDDTDKFSLVQALEASLEVSRRLEGQQAKNLGLKEGPPYRRSIPLLSRADEGYIWGSIKLPEAKKTQHQSITIRDAFTKARLQKAKSNGQSWCVRLFMHLDAYIPDDSVPDGKHMSAPVYPMVLLLVEEQSGMVLSVLMAVNPRKYAEELTPQVVDMVADHGRPASILVSDIRGYCLFENLAPLLKAKLQLVPSIPALEEAVEHFIISFEGEERETEEDQLEEIIAYIEHADSLDDMPDLLLRALLNMAGNPVLSKAAENKVIKEAKKRGYR